MSRDLEEENYYVSQGGKVPLKWTAPEALYYKRYSTASDIWSYGCLMYEIWSIGHKPFEEQTNAEVRCNTNYYSYIDSFYYSDFYKLIVQQPGYKANGFRVSFASTTRLPKGNIHSHDQLLVGLLARYWCMDISAETSH